MRDHIPAAQQIASTRHALRWCAVAAVVVLASACSRRAETLPLPLIDGPRWSGTLEVGGQGSGLGLSGSAAVSPSSNPDQSVAVLSVRGAPAGAPLPWHVHRGRCAAGGGPVVGPALNYEPLVPLADQMASRTATLPLTLPPGEAYYVDVHPSPDHTGAPVACADLALVQVPDR